MQRIVFQNQRICGTVCMSRHLKNLQKLSLGAKIRRSFIVRSTVAFSSKFEKINYLKMRSNLISQVLLTNLTLKNTFENITV